MFLFQLLLLRQEFVETTDETERKQYKKKKKTFADPFSNKIPPATKRDKHAHLPGLFHRLNPGFTITLGFRPELIRTLVIPSERDGETVLQRRTQKKRKKKNLCHYFHFYYLFGFRFD